MVARLGGPLWRARRKELIARDGMACHWCSRETVRMPSGHRGHVPEEACTIDHLIDLAKGGTNDIANLVIACNGCNHRRSRESISHPITESQLSKLLTGQL